MRLIIDSDTGSDDAVAIIMALRDKNVKVEAITTVFGNVELGRATKNALISIEQSGSDYIPPVFEGMENPLCSPVFFAKGVHGEDGLGDVGYPDPKLVCEREHAVDAMLRIVRENPGEIEICTLGRLTNVAMAVLREPQTMKLCKRITIMGGSFPEFTKWFTPVGEANIKGDVEAANIVMGCGVPILLVPLNVSRGDAVLTQEDMQYQLSTGSSIAKFCIECNETLISLNERRFGVRCLDPADQAALAACVYPECIESVMDAYVEFETKGELTRGCMVFYAEGNGPNKPNCTICHKLRSNEFREYMISHTM